MKVKAILAKSKNHAIGKGTGMPWKLRSDMKSFKDITTGSVLLVGVTTACAMLTEWPANVPFLAGRELIVEVTRGFKKDVADKIREIASRKNLDISNLKIFNAKGKSIPEILEKVETYNKGRDLFICGGAKTYDRYFFHCHEIYLTEVDVEIPAADDIVFLNNKTLEHALEPMSLIERKETAADAHNEYPAKYFRYVLN